MRKKLKRFGMFCMQKTKGSMLTVSVQRVAVMSCSQRSAMTGDVIIVAARKAYTG